MQGARGVCALRALVVFSEHNNVYLFSNQSLYMYRQTVGYGISINDHRDIAA